MDPDNNGFIEYRHFMQYFTPNLPDIVHQPAPFMVRKTLRNSANGNVIPNSDMLKGQINI